MAKYTKHYRAVPLKEVQVPRKEGNYRLIKNSWWAIDEKGDLLFWRGAPQCNKDKSIIVRFDVENEGSPAVAIMFVENAFVKIGG